MLKISINPSDDSEEEKEGPSEWEIEQAADTLLKAEEIRNDPELMAAVKEELTERRDCINSIADLKKVRNKKYKESQPKKEDRDGITEDLYTEEDKAALQDKKKLDKNIKDMGFKVDE
jgi:hypothetical protein